MGSGQWAQKSCQLISKIRMVSKISSTIEHIRAGDKVISTNPETGEFAEKKVLKTYIRETDRLVHLIVNGEEIITTVDHPFYVDRLGFVNAGELWVGAQLLDAKGHLLSVEEMRQELVEKPATVYTPQTFWHFILDIYHIICYNKYTYLGNISNHFGWQSLYENGIRTFHRIWRIAGMV